MTPDASSISQPSGDDASNGDPGFAKVRDFLLYGLSLPERTLRSASGLVGGTLRESASLLVPQAFRRSKTYTSMVKQMLDFMAEDVGGVARSTGPNASTPVENFVARKAIGNFVDMASMATLHLSPLLLLAVVSDAAYGSQVYLQQLSAELKQEGVIGPDSTIDNVDDLLAAAAETVQRTAGVFDTPPLSVAGLKQTIEDTRSAVAKIDPTKVIPQTELKRLWDDIHGIAVREGVNPLAVSGAMTLYSLDKIAMVGRGALSSVKAAGTLFDRHVIDHYADAVDRIRDRGLYKMLSETSRPYLDAVWRNFSGHRPTLTEDLLSGRMVRRFFAAVRERWTRRR